MISPDSRERLALLAIGVLVLLGPVLILVITLGILMLFGDSFITELTPIEFIELYIVDLILFIILAYGIYRLSLWVVTHDLIASFDDDGDDRSTTPHDSAADVDEDE